MNSASTSFTGDNYDNQYALSSESGNAIIPAVQFIVGAGNYMTRNPELYYPNACLFCGLPNGAKKEATTSSQAIAVATAAPSMHFYSAGTNEKPHNHLLEIIIHKHPTSRNLASIMSRLISNQFHAVFQKWRRYLIQKRLHFPVVTSSRKRFLIPSSFY